MEHHNRVANEDPPMSRVTALSIALGALALAAVPAFAGDAYTTRIEPRGFYGATISIEEGVRVFRPLPPTRHVIVNPGGATPLSLGFTDVRVNEQRTNYNYNYGSAPAASGGIYGGGLWGGSVYHRGVHGHHGKGARPGGVPAGHGHGGASGIGGGHR